MVSPPVPPRPLERALPGPGLLSQIIVGKVSVHLNTFRQEDIFTRHSCTSPAVRCATGAVARPNCWRLWPPYSSNGSCNRLCCVRRTPLPSQCSAEFLYRAGSDPRCAAPQSRQPARADLRQNPRSSLRFCYDECLIHRRTRDQLPAAVKPLHSDFLDLIRVAQSERYGQFRL